MCADLMYIGSLRSPNVYCHLHVGPISSVLQYGEGVDNSESPSAHNFHLFLFPQFWLNLGIPSKGVDGVGVYWRQPKDPKYVLPHSCWTYLKCLPHAYDMDDHASPSAHHFHLFCFPSFG